MNKHVKKLIRFVTRKHSLEFNPSSGADDGDSSYTPQFIFDSHTCQNSDRTKRKRGKVVQSDAAPKMTSLQNDGNVLSSSQCDVSVGGCNRDVSGDSYKPRDSIGPYCMMSSVGSTKEVHGLTFEEEETPTLREEVELTDDQKAELKQAFSMFEKTGKGRIQARDLGELLRCLGWNPSEQDLEEARHELELSTRGTISFSEVEAYIARRGGIFYGNNAEEDIMVAFQVLDKTGSGKITVSDFRHFMTTMGERMSHEEVEELIACSTRGGKDYIEYRDLVHAVQQSPT